MSSSLCKRNAIANSKIRCSGESELEELALEERLKNLLEETNQRKRSTRNPFRNIQEVPKLRRSVVVRAVENVVSSTPMPAEKTRNFFCTDNSLNISPIDPISEEVEPNYDKEKQNVEPDKEKEKEIKQAKVILTPLPVPIVISSESEDEEIQSIIKEKESRTDGTGIRNESQNVLQASSKQEKSARNKTVTDIAAAEVAGDSLTRNVTFRNKSNSRVLSNKKTSSFKKPDRSVQRGESPSRSRSGQVVVEPIRTRSKQRDESNKSVTSMKSMQQKSVNASKSRNEEDEIVTNGNVSKRVLRSSKQIENEREDDQQELKQPTPRKNGKRGIESNENNNRKEDVYQNIQHISYRELENLISEEDDKQSEPNEINDRNCRVMSPSPKKIIRDASANKICVKEATPPLKKNPHFRKLSFRSTEESDSNKIEVSVTKEEQPKVSKIPISKSRSKSRERIPEIIPNKRTVELREEKTDSSSGSHSSKENYHQHKKSPPKRPPRRKKLPRKKFESPITTCQSKDSSENEKSMNKKKIGRNSGKKTGFESKTIATSPLVLPEEEKNKTDRCDKAISVAVEDVRDLNSVKMVEVGTSPFSFIPLVTENEKVTTAVETTHITSSLNEGQNVSSSAKMQNINQLISKLAERSRASSNIKDIDKRRSTRHSRVSLLRDYSTRRLQMPMVSKEVQTSSFQKNDSKNSTSTDSSEIINGFEREMRPRILFETLGEDILNFTSDEEEVPEITPQSSTDKLPWRLDENLDIFPRRSSYKLNFLRSAQEIELDKTRPLEEQTDFRRRTKVQMYSSRYRLDNNKSVPQIVSRRSSHSSMSDLAVDESNSESELQLEEPGREMVSAAGNSRNKLRSLEKVGKDVTQQNTETEINATIQSQKNDSTLKEPTQEDINASNRLEENVINNHSRKSNLQTREEVEENGLREGDNVVEMRHENTDAIDGGAITNTTDKVTENLVADEEILAVPLEDSQPAVAEKPPEEIVLRRSTRRSKSSHRTDVLSKKPKSRSISASATDNIVEPPPSAIVSEHATENIMRTPSSKTLYVSIEKTPPSAITQMPVVESNEKTPPGAIASTSVEENVIRVAPGISSPVKSNNNEIVNENATSVVKKAAKSKGRKPRTKKVVQEVDDAVSSSTADSEDGGIRRSRRERKVVQRRCYAVIETHSKRDYQYYNSISVTSEIDYKNVASSTQIKSRPTKSKKKKENSSDTTSDNQVFKKPEAKKSTAKKRGRPSKLTKNAPNGVATDSNDSTSQSNNPSSSQTKVNRTRKHSGNPHGTTNNIIPTKRNKTINNLNDESNKDKTLETPINSNISSYHLDNGPNPNVDNIPADDAETNTNGIRSGIGAGMYNSFRLQKESLEDDCGFYSDVPQDNFNSMGDVSNIDKALDKDSGRSTMLKSCSLEKTRSRVGKPLTGRISKSYKKKDMDVPAKISKVLSRSLNTSQEQEIPSENDVNRGGENRKSKVMSIVESALEDSEYITLSSNDSVLKMKYVEQTPSFKVVKDNLMVADGLKNIKDGGAMGYLKLPPSSHKPLHIARRFALLYFVISGEGLIQVHNVNSKVFEHSTFIIPLGVEYSIHNTSKDKYMLLGFVKMTSTD